MPLSPEKADLLRRLESEVARRMASSNAAPPTPTIADMRRREEQGQVAALPPEQVQSQLQEAVDQSK